MQTALGRTGFDVARERPEPHLGGHYRMLLARGTRRGPHPFSEQGMKSARPGRRSVAGPSPAGTKGDNAYPHAVHDPSATGERPVARGSPACRKKRGRSSEGEHQKGPLPVLPRTRYSSSALLIDASSFVLSVSMPMAAGPPNRRGPLRDHLGDHSESPLE